jgi:uncharacterized protein YqiB (DUF1249 family)
MVSFVQKNGMNQRPRIGKLQSIQEEIYRQLHLLLPDSISHFDVLESRVNGSPPLLLHLLERHPYTTFLRLTYAFKDTGSNRFGPDAHIRLYHDAKIAEVTSFSTKQGIRRFASPFIPARNAMLRAWRQNRALEKWLDYVLNQGHHTETMLPASSSKAILQLARTPVTVG